ncbi:MAG: hypothetical protein LC660_17945 [Desulfobacteraceae bacterium]|nr:hypothetical protein [Desulfobacteraceae bacterium]
MKNEQTTPAHQYQSSTLVLWILPDTKILCRKDGSISEMIVQDLLKKMTTTNTKEEKKGYIPT